MKPGVQSLSRTPLSISWPQRRGSSGEESIGEKMARVAMRTVTVDIVEGIIEREVRRS